MVIIFSFFICLFVCLLFFFFFCIYFFIFLFFFLFIIFLGGLIQCTDSSFVNIGLSSPAALLSVPNGGAIIRLVKTSVSNFSCNTTNGTLINAPGTTVNSVSVYFVNVSVQQITVTSALRGSLIYVQASNATLVIQNSSLGDFSVKFFFFFFFIFILFYWFFIFIYFYFFFYFYSILFIFYFFLFLFFFCFFVVPI
jgi:hypothetical protein